jgi:hypothetical protein
MNMAKLAVFNDPLHPPARVRQDNVHSSAWWGPTQTERCTLDMTSGRHVKLRRHTHAPSPNRGVGCAIHRRHHKNAPMDLLVFWATALSSQPIYLTSTSGPFIRPFSETSSNIRHRFLDPPPLSVVHS